MTNPLHPHNVVLCDSETDDNTKTYLQKTKKDNIDVIIYRTLISSVLSGSDAGVWLTVSQLTLSAPRADLPEAGALAHPVQPLLLDQLSHLRLEPLTQLPKTSP